MLEDGFEKHRETISRFVWALPRMRMLLTEEIGIETSIERISGIRTIQNGGGGIN